MYVTPRLDKNNVLICIIHPLGWFLETLILRVRTLFTGVCSEVNELNHSTTRVLLLLVMAFYLLTYWLLFYGHDLQFLIFFFSDREREGTKVETV